MSKKIVVLSGAGISAESGLKTFRDSDGLWEGHKVMDVASLQGFQKDPKKVFDFYNERRRQLLEAKPNSAHFALAELEMEHEVSIITQNVDNLHERAGSQNVIHLHGELLKVRSTWDETVILDWHTDLNLGDLCERQSQLRPHIVWFGETVPMMDVAIDLVDRADVLIIVGTSMQVYPAAGLLQFASPDAKIFFVDPNPSIATSKRIMVFSEKATTGIPKVVLKLKKS